MLVPYQNGDQNNQKIIMSLLSYLSTYKELKDLTNELENIKSDRRRIMFWKDEATQNFVGLLGYNRNEDQKKIILRYITLSPSFREEGLVYDILDDFSRHFPNDSITTGLDLAEIYSKWQGKRKGND